MSKTENRMNINVHELNNLNEWLTRLKCSIDNVELRWSIEPNLGPAITAYVETDDDEGFFKLLTPSDIKNV